jgi:TetR/AcrR family transcriptional regulator
MDDVESRRAGGLNGCEPDAHARARLLRAAADVFDRKGYAAASVREIVEQAGITKPVLYYHFGSKEGILLAILEEGARQFQRTLAGAAGRPGTARERLVGLCEEIFTLFKQNVPVVRVAHAVYFGPREGLPAFDFNKFDGALSDSLRCLVEEGMATGELRHASVEDVVVAINGVIGLCTDLELNPHSTPIGCGGLRRVLDLIFDGLSATRDKKEN